MAKTTRYQNRIELLQGTLDLLVLQTLQWGPQHGYNIAQAISDISTRVARFRPMYCASTPSGKRMRAPARIGIDNINPVCAGVSAKLSLMNGAMAPFSTQIKHENVK